MKARFEDVPWSGNESFMVRFYDLPKFNVPWHFHPELELTLILEGSGNRCVGDHLERFTAGDLVVVGPELPHYWHSDTGDASGRARAVVVHLRQDSFGPGFFGLPELTDWQRLVDASCRGLHYQEDDVIAEITERMRTLELEKGARRLLALWEIIERLSAGVSAARPLASEHYVPARDRRNSGRLARVHQYIHEHLDEPITLEAVAAVAGMTGSGFSRYFRHTTGRTLTTLINELRITQVCKLLVETDQSITEIAFAAGFQSISNFNRAFMEVQGTSPQTFRKQRERQP